MITFDDILDQAAAVDWLRRAYQTQHMPHGMILAGPTGVGKATTARALAALWLCEKPKDAMPCGKCESCRVFEAGNHPDYHVVTKELIRYHDKTGKSKGIDLSINVIRPEVIDPAGRKAAMGQGKVFVIEQAELMTAQAQNALLKTLEEPAGRTLIILLTDQSDLLLPTIRSRCQLLRFSSIPQATVKAQLVKRGIEKSAAQSTAELSDGSLGLALKWLEDGVADSAKQLTQMLEQLIEGAPPSNLGEWFKKAADSYAEKQLARDELASKDQAMREGLALYLRLAAHHFATLMRERTDSPTLESAAGAIEAIVRAEKYLDANVNIPLVFQQLTLSLEKCFVANPVA
jgi:DNA polymerase-3 subunit delta'